jgi:hypothetical protein
VTPAQDALKQEALGWGIPADEIDHVLRRHDLAMARNLLWQGH